jgi:ATP-dependent Clp protease ATP-binding subunit ClpC
MSDFLEKFTDNARGALLQSEKEALLEKSGYIGTEHALLGIAKQKNCGAMQVLVTFGVTAEKIARLMQAANMKKTYSENVTTGLSGFAKKNIENAIKIAYAFGEEKVGTEHLLLSLVKQKDTTAANVILRNINVEPRNVAKKIETALEQKKLLREKEMGQSNQTASADHPLARILGNIEGLLNMVSRQQQVVSVDMEGEDAPNEETDSRTPTLDFFATDFTDLAMQQKLDPLIGREQELERMIAIISRKTKNNPCLIGEPGVGKTALVEGLAQKVIDGDVPSHLLDKRIMGLNLTSLVAGTKFRGEFEQRIKKILDEAMKKENEIILFIDEIHTIIGTGSAEGSLDAANILKPLLARGELQCIGATTFDEYKKYIEKDAALERRFQKVTIEEPTVKEAIRILHGVAGGLEDFHNLRIETDAITSAVELSKQYIHDRFLPDKAIDLLDETCAYISMHKRGKHAQIKKLQTQLSKLQEKRQKAVSSQNYKKAGELQIQEKVLVEKIQTTKTANNTPRGKRKSMTEDNIRTTLSRNLGIPLHKISTQTLQVLGKLDKALDKYIIGQDQAVISVSKAIARARLGLTSEKRPLSSFLFLGPTGVGKTEMCKTLAREVFGSDNHLIKIDMSEFSEKHNVSRLIGATAGYVGYENGGELTEKVRKKPYSVVLFDEIEKAHEEVLNILLQIMQDGMLTDGKGRSISFQNTIIILTSNIGADRFADSASKIGFSLTEDEEKKAKKNFDEIEKEIQGELEDYLLPELLSRLNETIIFRPLESESLRSITLLQMNELKERLYKKEQTELTWTNHLITHLTQKSFDQKQGARKVQKVITKKIEDAIASELLAGNISFGSKIHISLKREKIIIK